MKHALHGIVLLGLSMACAALAVSSCKPSVDTTVKRSANADKAQRYAWSKSPVSPRGVLTCLTCGPDGRVFIGILHGTILRSEAGGQRWQESSQGIKECFIWDLMSDADGRIYAATGRGVYRSVDGGSSWGLVNRGLTNLGVTSLASSPDGTMYAGTRTGVFRLDAKEERWARTGPSLPYPDASPDAVAIDSGGTIYQLTSNQLFRAQPGAKQWSRCDFSKKQENPTCLLIDGRGTVYVGFHQVGVSEDSGREEWTTAPPLMKSKDGEHWEAVSIGDEPLYVNDLACGPDNEIIVGTNRGPFASYDGGANWRKMIPDLVLPDALIPDLPAELSQAPCLVEVDSAGRVYYLLKAEQVIWCGTPVADP